MLHGTTENSLSSHITPARDVRTIIFIAFLGLFLSGYNNFMIAIALIELQPRFDLGPVALGMILAATFMGMLVGGVTLGHLADKIGRRPAMIINTAAVAIFALLSGIVTNPIELIVMRLLIGIGIGAGYPIGSSFVADVSTASARGRNMTLAFCGWGFGALGCGLTGWLLLTICPPVVGWRYMLASGAVPALVALVVITIRKLPESHSWKHCRTLEALPFRALFRPGIGRLTLAALLPWFLMDLPVYGIGLLMPTLLKELHVGGSNIVVLSTCILSLFTLVGFFFAYLTIDRTGRRPLQIIGFLGMAVLFGILAMEGTGIHLFLLLALFAGIQVFVNAGPNTTTWIVAAEVFPTRLRARGQGSATAFSRIGAASGAFFLPVINARAGLSTAFTLVAIASVLAAIITLIYLPETARQELPH